MTASDPSLTPLDNAKLTAALDAYAVHVGAVSWKAFTDVVPLLAEIRWLRAGADATRAEPCTEQTPAQLWHWLLEAPINARLGFVTKLLGARAAERAGIKGRCRTKENS